MRDLGAWDDLREMDLIVLRHCEKAGDGLSDPLTARGAADAEKVRDALMEESVDAIFASPYRRSQETIAPFAATSGLNVVTDARLAEWRISAAALAEIFDHGPKVVADRHYRPPWSETGAECWDRVEQALRSIRATGARRPVLACHGGILGVILSHIADEFEHRHWATFHQPTAIAVHRGAWTRIETA